MTTSLPSQGDFFAPPTFETLSALLGPDGRPPLFVIGCGRKKEPSATEARALYLSSRFRTCRAMAENLSATYLVLSARHGLITANKTLEPYDLDVSTLSKKLRRDWANSVLDRLEKVTDGSPITLLATNAYASPVLLCNAKRSIPLPISAPLTNIALNYHQAWLDQALSMATRIQHLGKFYGLIELAQQRGRTFHLRGLSNQNLPERGVYIFLDPSEQNFIGKAPRIVRIGTHAISRGSKSSLRNRLKNHLGLLNGSGNHRGSIFRLHVGRAMLEVEGADEQIPSWGKGQAAPLEIRAGEQVHERRVSEYLRGLEVFVLPIDDEPSKDSLRAHTETQLIALCTEAMQTIDKPNPAWLGLQSPMVTIVQSGLWNLRDVGRPYIANGPGSVDHILSFSGTY